jgi:hypothetical protein
MKTRVTLGLLLTSLIFFLIAIPPLGRGDTPEKPKAEKPLKEIPIPSAGMGKKPRRPFQLSLT